MAHNTMDEAPRDGTPILAFWFNGCAWECVVVWWSKNSTYPWSSDYNEYPDDAFDCWQSIEYPETNESL